MSIVAVGHRILQIYETLYEQRQVAVTIVEALISCSSLSIQSADSWDCCTLVSRD